MNAPYLSMTAAESGEYAVSWSLMVYAVVVVALLWAWEAIGRHVVSRVLHWLRTGRWVAL